MARRVKLETNLGNIRPHTRQVFEEFAERFDVHFAWGIGDSGDHKAGKALDLMAYSRGDGPQDPGPIRPGWNKQVAEYAWANRTRLGIDYVIYDQLIQSNNPGGYAYGGWQPYRGKSHANHVHISFEESPPAYRPPTTVQPEDDMPTAAEIVDELLARQVPLSAGEQARYDGYPASISVRSLLVHAGAGTWSLARDVADVLAATSALAKPMTEEERDALSSSIADKVDRLRLVIEHHEPAQEETHG